MTLERRLRAPASLADLPDQRLSLARLEAMFERSPLSIAFWDQELRFVRINDLAASMDGMSAADHIGRTFREVVGESVADSAEPMLRSVLETGVPVTDVEVTGVWPTGGERHFLASFYPVSARAGELVGVGAIGIDVTHRRLLIEMKERERQALEINDNVVQGLTVALLAIEEGDSNQAKLALRETLARARDIVGDLIGTNGGNTVLGPNRLRRRKAAPRFLKDAE